MNIEPDDIITAFDEILDYTFGRSRGRDYPAKEDKKYAKEWLEDGLTMPIACCVFHQKMSQMHDLWMRDHDHTNNKNIPATLKFFDEFIRSALSRVRAGGDPIATWEQSESQWRARLIGFYSKNFWNVDMWGAIPGEDGCRCPPRLIAERKKTA